MGLVAAIFGGSFGPELSVDIESVGSDGLIEQGGEFGFLALREAAIGKMQHLVGSGNDGLSGFCGIIKDEGLAFPAEAAEPFDITFFNYGCPAGELRVGAIQQGAAGVGQTGDDGKLDGFGGGFVAQEEDFVAEILAIDEG